MEANAKKHLKIRILCAVSGLVVIGGVWMHQENKVSSNEHKTHVENVSTKHYLHDRDTFTASKLKARYDKEEPDLGSILADNRTRIKHGMTLAFNDSHNQSDYSGNKPKITHYLGSEMANKVFPLIVPQHFPHYKQPVSMADSMTSFDIGYGPFDPTEKLVPVMIIVKYSTPKVSIENGDGSSTGREKVHTGQLAIDATLFTKSNTLQVNHEHNSMDGQPVPDTMPGTVQD